MKTICKKCSFAIWDGNKQTGCKFNGRLDKFKALNLVEIEKDENLEYYKIDRFCNACVIDNDNVEEIYKFIQPKVDYILIVGEKSNEEIISTRINEILKSEIKPKSLYIILNNTYIEASDIYKKYFDILNKEKIKLIAIKLLEFYDDETSCLGTLWRCKNQFVTIFDSEKQIPQNIISIMHKLINEDLERFLIIKPESGYHGVTMSSNLSKIFKNGISIENRIQEIEKANARLVKEWKLHL